MSYEQLIELGENVGTVSKGLKKEQIEVIFDNIKKLRKTKYTKKMNSEK